MRMFGVIFHVFIIAPGFQETLNSIISFLPPTKQTLLFSATQTRSIKDLARLSLNVLLCYHILTKDNN